MPIKNYLDLKYHHIQVFDGDGELLFAFRTLACAANAMVFYKLHTGYVMDMKTVTMYDYSNMREHATIH